MSRCSKHSDPLPTLSDCPGIAQCRQCSDLSAQLCAPGDLERQATPCGPFSFVPNASDALAAPRHPRTRTAAPFAFPRGFVRIASDWEIDQDSPRARTIWDPMVQARRPVFDAFRLYDQHGCSAGFQKPDRYEMQAFGCRHRSFDAEENSLLPMSARPGMSKRCREGMRWRRRGSLGPREARCWKGRPRRRRRSNTGSSPTNPSHAYRRRTSNTLRNSLIFRSS